MKHIKVFEQFKKPKGTGDETFWEKTINGKKVKITLDDVIDKAIKPFIIVDPTKLKDLLIDVERDPKRVNNADLNYPIVLSKKDGKYHSIIDGHHRVVKALNDKKGLKAYILDLDNSPSIYSKFF